MVECYVTENQESPESILKEFNSILEDSSIPIGNMIYFVNKVLKVMPCYGRLHYLKGTFLASLATEIHKEQPEEAAHITQQAVDHLYKAIEFDPFCFDAELALGLYYLKVEQDCNTARTLLLGCMEYFSSQAKRAADAIHVIDSISDIKANYVGEKKV